MDSGAPGAPVIILTANDLEIDIVTGLESGADDYITKPFSLMVLRARVRARLRNMQGGTTNGEWAGAEYTDRTVFLCI